MLSDAFLTGRLTTQYALRPQTLELIGTFLLLQINFRPAGRKLICKGKEIWGLPRANRRVGRVLPR